MRYKVGDKVRVRRDLNEDMTCNEFIVTTPMADKAGDIVTISAVHRRCYHIVECGCAWTDEMFEPVEDELTAEEAIKIQAEMCSTPCRNCPISKEKGVDDCITFKAEHPDEVIEILKQWKKDHEKKEVETEFINIVRVIEDLDDSKRCVYEEDVTKVKNETFKMTMKRILKEYCKDHEGKFFTVYEETCRVKE